MMSQNLYQIIQEERLYFEDAVKTQLRCSLVIQQARKAMKEQFYIGDLKS